jgi:hypothetical protein
MEERMNPDDPMEPIGGTPGPMGYLKKVSALLQKVYAGRLVKPSKDDHESLTAVWTQALMGLVPEARLDECYVQAVRSRKSTHPVDVSEMCAAWAVIEKADKTMPPIGTYDWSRSRAVCAKCNGTGTELIVKRHPILGRDYTYGRECKH